MLDRTALLLAFSLFLCSAFAADASVRITIDDPTPGRTVPWPVYAAVALPDGYAVQAEELSVTDSAGRPVSAWVLPVSRWRSGGALKWAHVRFVARPGAEYRLVKSPRAPEAPLPVEKRGDDLLIRTGALELLAGKGVFKVAWNGQPVLDGLSQRVLDSTGKPFAATVQSVEVERQTPIEVTLVLSGAYSPAARYALRATVFKDVPVLFLDHAWRFLGDMNKDRFREISLELGLSGAPEGEVRFLLGAEGARGVVLDPAWQSLSMAQELAFHLNDAAPFTREFPPLSKAWADATANPDFKSPYGPDHYGLYANTAAGEKVLIEGRRCGDGLVFTSSGVPMAAALADFWQNFPKEWEISPKALKLHLWSKRGGELDFSQDFGKRWYRKVAGITRGGEVRAGDPRTLEKRETFLLAFGDAARGGVAGYASKAPEAVVDPVSICAANVFDLPVVPRGANNADPKLATIENTIDALYDDMLKAVEATGGCGWQEAGHGPHYNYPWDDTNKRLLVNNYRWFNHFYYLHRNLWVQYFRGGERKYADMLNRHFRHFLDLQVCHGEERDNLSPGSWCKDSLCYWENWQEGWKYTYQRTAREVMYYLARTGDPRARWQLEQWRGLFLAWARDKDLAQWADGYRNWGGNDFSAWRVPATAVANLVTLHEILGDPRLLDMAVALALSFEDAGSPSGTRYLYSAGYEYTMYSNHDEYYRIPAFHELAKLTNDPRVTAMTEKLARFWLLQRSDRHDTYDLAAQIAFERCQDPRAASMLKTFVEDVAARGGYLDVLRRPFGPGGPQGALHPSNDEKMVFGMFPSLIAMYPKIIRAGGEGVALRRFKPVNDFPVWVGLKQAGKPFVMSVLCPGRDRARAFHDAAGKEIPKAFVAREEYRQQVGWMFTQYVVRLPADFPAGQVWSSGDPGRVNTGSEDVYLFYPGRYLYLKPDSGAICFLRPGPNPIAPGGEAKFTFRDADGPEITPKSVDAQGFGVYEPAGGVLGLSGQMHWTRGAFFNLSKVPVEKRFGFIGDAKAVFDVAPAVVAGVGEAKTVVAPPVEQEWQEGVSGRSFHVVPGRGLTLGAPLNVAEGCLEFWIQPLWDTEQRGGGGLVSSNVVDLGGSYVGLLRATTGGDGADGSFIISRPEGEGAPLVKGKWYHVAMTWRVLDKAEGRTPKGSGVMHFTVDGRLVRFDGPTGINARVKPDRPLTFTAGKDTAYLIDEIRISKTPRYLTRSVPGFSWQQFGGFDLKAVTPPAADAATLALYHLDGDLKGLGPSGAARPLEVVK
jgi:hypothetical protein